MSFTEIRNAGGRTGLGKGADKFVLDLPSLRLAINFCGNVDQTDGRAGL